MGRVCAPRCAAVIALVGLLVAAVAGCGSSAPRPDSSTSVVPPSATPIPTVVVLDSSESMATSDAPGPRIDAARAAVRALVGRVPDSARVGLITYGATVAVSPTSVNEGCADVDVAVPLGPLRRDAMVSATTALVPRGFTPIGLALRRAADELPRDQPTGIVLVSDGESTCAPDPCAVAREIRATHPLTTVSTIGFRTDSAALRCISSATGGVSITAENATQLSARLFALQDPQSAAASLSPEGAFQLRLGQPWSEVRRANPDFPALAQGARSGDRVVVTWRDCEWGFDARDVLVSIGARRTIDGVAVGGRVAEADSAYGQPLGEDAASSSPTPATDGMAPNGGVRTRLYSTGRNDGTSAWRIASRDGVITAITLCACRPQARRVAPTPLPSSPPAGGVPPDCAANAVTGRVDFTHPTWGPTRLFALGPRETSPRPACLVAVDATGATRWSHQEDDYQLAIPTPGTDATGNLFVTYNPGRYDGVIVLRPTTTGFQPFETSYGTGRLRYYYASLVGPDGSGRYAIKSSRNDCDPDCAGGTITSQVLRWNGDEYTP